MIPLGVLASSVGAPAAVGVQFLHATYYDPPNLSATFSSVPLGTPAANRNIIVAFGTRAGGPFGACTIGGVSATAHADYWSSGAATYRVAIYSAVVPSGSSGTVTVATSGNSETMTLGAWSAHGALSYVGAQVGRGSAISITGSGLTIAATAETNSGTITALTGVTEDYALPQWCRSHGGHTTATGSLTITPVGQGISNACVLAVDFTLTS